MKQLYTRSYFAARVRTGGDGMVVKPQSGDAALAETFYELLCQLGEPGPGSLIAVWELNETADRLDHDTVAKVCSLVRSSLVYLVLENGDLAPLSGAASEDMLVEVPE